MNPVLEDIYRTGKCVDLAGNERKVMGAVPREDALILQEMVRFVKAKTTLETGVSFGLSTLAICEALKEAGSSTDYADYTDSKSPASGGGGRVRHYDVDREQTASVGGAALASLKRAGLESVFELREGPHMR